jgi:acyl-coenzyme A synthetase/AMP-(fatty) acid ligase
MSVVGPILHFGKVQPDAAALVDGDRVLTYAGLGNLVLRTATHLANLGIKRGDRVGLCLRDAPHHLVALLAVARAGAVATPLDWRAPPAENGPLIAGLGLKCVLTESGAREIPGCLSIAVDADWHQAVARSEMAVGSSVAWEDDFVLSASSGSTGLPKFTVMTHRQFFFAIVAMWELMALAGRHRFLSNLPLFYSGGRNSCLAHLLRGDSVLMYPSLFSSAEYAAIVNRRHITVAAVVPSMVRQLLAVNGDEPMLPGLAALFCTGAPLHAEEKNQALRQLTPRFHERYGTAETLAISVLRPKDMALRSDSVGQPHSLAEIEIVDENLAPLPVGAIGRLRFRAPGMGSPLRGNVAERSFRDGWFYPGEIARVDEAAYIFLQGRTTDVIMRSGAKIFPAEVEATLISLRGVLDAAVLGRRGADQEEAVIAFVVTDENVTAGDLLAHCRGQLSPHKVPQQFRFVSSLPKNTAGKTDRLALATLIAPEPGA